MSDISLSMDTGPCPEVHTCQTLTNKQAHDKRSEGKVKRIPGDCESGFRKRRGEPLLAAGNVHKCADPHALS